MTSNELRSVCENDKTCLAVSIQSELRVCSEPSLGHLCRMS